MTKERMTVLNTPHPVIYLTLGRLTPLFELTNADPEHDPEKDFQKLDLDSNELKIIQHIHRALISIEEQIVSIERLTSKIKTESQENTRKMTGETEKYGKYGMSAGQDVIIQISSAILSFKRLKEEMKGKYEGGLLLIDEVEATLHPSAQRNLIQILNQYSTKYNIQVVLTTHSWSLIQDSWKKKAQINYITKDNGIFELIADLKQIEEDMFLQAFDHKKNKITIPSFCEDEVAKKFLQCVVSQENKNEINIEPIGHGYVIRSLAKNFSKCKLTPCIWFLDGDQSKLKDLEKFILVLPSNQQLCPEHEIYNFLEGLSPSDALWKSIGYTKAKMLVSSSAESIESAPDDSAKRLWKLIKNKSRKVGDKTLTGNTILVRIIKEWMLRNKNLVDAFNFELEQLIKKTRKGSPK